VRRSLGIPHPVSTSRVRDHGIHSSTQTDDDFAYVISYTGEGNLVIGSDYRHGHASSDLNAGILYMFPLPMADWQRPAGTPTPP